MTKMKMGKLIDAEWLKKYVRNVGIYCDTDADKEYTCEKIDKFPTVEAIPVEWLKDQIEIASSNGEDDYASALDWTVMKWQTEVEDGQTD